MNVITENWKFIQFVIYAGFALVIWALAVTFTKKKDHGELSGRVKSLEETYTKKEEHIALAQKVNTIETQIKDLPNSKDFNRLEKEVSELKGSVNGMNKLLTNINNHVNMLWENEVKGSK